MMMVLHLAVALVAAGCLFVSESVWHRMFPGADPLVMGLFPFRWILEAGEAGITPTMTVLGLYDAIRVMLER